MLAHTDNPNTWEAGAEGLWQFKASLGYSETLSRGGRSHWREKRGMGEGPRRGHACNFSAWEAEQGGQKFGASLGYIIKFYLENLKSRKE